MANGSANRGALKSAIWPWPGIALLVLVGAWMIYMGSTTTSEDVRDAFFGLTGVTALLLLLAFRARNRSLAQKLFDEEPETTEERYVPATPPSRAQQNVDDFDDDDMDDIGEVMPATPPQGPEDTRAIESGAGASGNVHALNIQRDLPRLEPLVLPQKISGSSGKDILAALKQLEAMVQREAAERGALMARLNERDSRSGLEERLNQYLTIQAFNQAMHSKVFPRMEGLAKSAIEDQLDSDEFRTELLARMGSGGDGGQHNAVALAEMRQAIEAQKEEAQAERNVLREEVRGARKMAEKAVRMINRQQEVVAADGATAMPAAFASDLAKLKKEMEAVRDRFVPLEVGLIPDDEESQTTAGNVMRRLRREAIEAKQETVRLVEDNIDTLQEKVALLTKRLDQLDARPGGSAPQSVASVGSPENEEAAASAPEAATETIEPVSPPQDQSEVDALRSALSTIIEQNREIRAQQEVLSARFDAPVEVGVDQDKKD